MQNNERFMVILEFALLLVLTVGLLTPTMGAGITPPDINRFDQHIAACIDCHGKHGGGDATYDFPRLAGQPHAYLLEQLEAFQSGQRHNAIMVHMVQRLPYSYLDKMARYFSRQKAKYPLPADVAPALLAEGKRLVNDGDRQSGIPACTSCHGSRLEGTSSGIPALAGQYPDYLSMRLGAWRNGLVAGHVSKRLLAAHSLPNAQVKAVVVYLSSLRPGANASHSRGKAS